jgi:phosphoribosylglycinamide formyltransferase-1
VQSAIERGEIEAEIAFVFSNREPGEYGSSDCFFDLVRSYGIPIVTFSYRKFMANHADRKEYDRQIMKRLAGYSPELCVLAGYMLIVGNEMCRRYDMINLHPAAPGGPTGTWQEVIHRLIRKGADDTGVMMHLVTPELDKGPVVSYTTFPIRGKFFDRYRKEIEPLSNLSGSVIEKNPLFRIIREEGLKREFPLIIATLKAFGDGRIEIKDGRVTDSDGRTINGYDLSEEIEAIIENQAVKGGELDK